MNRASHYGQGAMLSVSQFGGALKHNLSLLMQTTYYPVGDFSPGYDVSYTHKWFEVGGGAVFHHYLPLRPSALVRKEGENTLIRMATGTDSLGDTTYYIGPNFNNDNLNDPGMTLLHRWTHKGIKVMGRAALNLNHLLPVDIRNPEDLRVFGEVALLGVENQPLYYEKQSERMPVMFGVNRAWTRSSWKCCAATRRRTGTLSMSPCTWSAFRSSCSAYSSPSAGSLSRLTASPSTWHT
jgi:hypothetical protein